MKKVNSVLASVVCAAIACSVFTSCKNGGDDNTQKAQDTVLSDAQRIDSLTTEKKNDIDFKFATLAANLPSPFDVVNDLYSYKAPYKADLLNPTANAEKYTTPFKKEINFGVYGIDLAYINFYGQNQEMLNYYNTIQKLAQDLNIASISEAYAERFKTNANNHDSVVVIVDNIFSATDAYLSKNDRYLVASHIIAGSIVEVNYLSLNLLKDIKRTPETEKLFVKVYNENLALYHLINLYEKYTDKDSKMLLENIKVYRKSYDEIIKSADDMNAENITKAAAMITTLRNKLI
ncbi:MAG: hypothetical protein H7257_04430 [Taibaiella sp.]|nr:hypothetical protein [Taibaiella sp.]